MSATLRAAALVAIPTAVISIFGIYWLQRRKKKHDDYPFHRVRNHSSSKLKATSHTSCNSENCDNDKPEDVDSKCVRILGNTESNACDNREGNEDNVVGINNSNDSPQKNNLEVGREKETKSNALVTKNADSCSEHMSNSKSYESISQISGSAKSKSFTEGTSDNLKSNSSVVNNGLYDNNSMQTVNENSQTELLSCSRVNPVAHELILSDNLSLHEDVNEVSKSCDKLCSVLDVSLIELSNDVFVENESKLSSQSGVFCSEGTERVMKEAEGDVSSIECGSKESTESGCFVSYSSESVGEVEMSTSSESKITQLDDNTCQHSPKRADDENLKLLDVQELLKEYEHEQKETENKALPDLHSYKGQNVETENDPQTQAEAVQNIDLQTVEEVEQKMELLEQLERLHQEQSEAPGGQEELEVTELLGAPSKLQANGLATPGSNSSSCGEATGEFQSAISSDSGQGGSNGPPTPPDNEPTELHADGVTYEFDFPSQLCGMLIGRNGRHINGISRDSGALISVKQKAFVTEYQTVSLQGTQKQVSDALEIIKSRFPVNKFPGISFEKSSESPNPTSDIQLAQITLPEGGFVDVIVSSVVSLDRIFVQQPVHPSFVLLNYLNDCMWACYNQGPGAALILPPPVTANTLCVAPMFGGWFRAQVVESTDDSEQCLVRFVDYGGYCSIDKSSLRQIRGDFTALPFQAVECFLNGITSLTSQDDASSIQTEGKAYLENLVRSRSLLAEVVGYSADGAPFINLYQIYGDQIYSVNEELIANSSVLQQQVMPMPASNQSANDIISS